MPTDVPIKKLILVPALITLAVTLLRLTGELLHWSPRLFSRAAGGGGALVGIAWLVPIFGVYFAWRLAQGGEHPSSALAAASYPLLGGLLLPAVGFAAAKLGVGAQSVWMLLVFVVASVAGGLIAVRGWPALGRVLFAYGLAARIPVAIVMLVAILANWGTHYDVAPPDFPAMGPLARWALTGLLPQMTIWIWYTVVLGGLLGGVAAAILRFARRPAVA
jgi:hypothetical protein